MTLHTRIFVTTPGVDPRAAFLQMRQLLGAGEQYDAYELPDPTSDDEWRRTCDPSINMSLSQGLPALMWIDHWNGELSPAHDHDEDCLPWDDNGPVAGADPDCSPGPRGYLEVNIDTGYAYKSAADGHCGDLHAWLIREFGAWLQARGASWEWYDESGSGWDHGPGWGSLGDPDRGALTAADHALSEQHRLRNLAERRAS